MSVDHLNAELDLSDVCALLQVFSMTNELPPDSRRPLDTYYDQDLDRLQTYSMEVISSCRTGLQYVFLIYQLYH